MILRSLAAAAAIALSASPILAGMTPSYTVPVQMDEVGTAPVEACDATVFDYDLNFSATFMVQGEITNWYVLTGANIDNFIIYWNNTHPDNKLPVDVKFDAVIGFVDPDGSITGEAGEYALLYLDGCFVSFVKVPLPPANVTPPPGEPKPSWDSLKQWQMFGYIGLR